MKRLVLLLICSGCSETSEMTAWRQHRDQLNLQVAELELVRIDSHAAERLAVMKNDMRALEEKFDVVAKAREVDAGVKVTQDERGLLLTFDGPLAACRDALRALTPHRKLTLAWRLRIDQGQCHWSANETPALRAWRLEVSTPPPPWKPPPSERFSRGIDAYKKEIADIESAGALHRADLGPLAALPELKYRYDRAAALVPILEAAAPPCDRQIIERAVERDAGTLLEATADSLVHPLTPSTDPRLDGLADFSTGRLRWTCGE
ncbi:MAG: hypothetical protein QM817_23930 [Archangium sp.]